MLNPKIIRPTFPNGYLLDPKTLLSWAEVETKLIAAKNYWLCSVHPKAHPHVVPKWAVWVADQLYFDGSPETRHAKNIALNPNVSVNLESGDEAVILYGTARAVAKPQTELATQVARAYSTKYAALGYAPEPSQWDNGGLFVIRPQHLIAWTKFTDDPTKFIFES